MMLDLLGDLFLQDPNLAAAWGTWLAVVFAGIALTETYRTRMRNAVVSAMQDLTSRDLAASRDRVAAASLSSASPIGSPSPSHEELRHDVFVLIWAVERLSTVKSSARTALATDELQALYAHVDTVVESINNARQFMNSSADVADSAVRANRVLESLPDARTPWGRIKGSAPSKRLQT
jgi:hypothetical protein